MAGYLRNDIVNGITIHRLYVNHPDEVGSLAYWEAAFLNLISEMPVYDFWNGLDVWIWDMRHPSLTDKRGKEITLHDFDLNTPGNQVAAGLFYHKDKLEIAVIPRNWDVNKPWEGTITQDSIDGARNVLCHEVGHYYANQCGYMTGSSVVEKEVTRFFNALRPKKAANEGEDFAEVYHAYFGVPGRKGFFSDMAPFTTKGRLFCVMKTAYKLVSMLKNKDVKAISFHDDYVEWEEWALVTRYFLFFPYLSYEMIAKKRMDLNFKVY